MKKQIALLSLSIGCFLTAFSQSDPVVMKINDKNVTLSEFEAVYRKNNSKELPNFKSVKEYAELYSLFKMKVLEAESKGLDTLSSFKKELAGYRTQLANPYLTDKNTNENLLTEAYERLKTEVRVSHIMVRLDGSALPKDTLEGWTRMNLIRNTLLGKMPTKADIENYRKLLLVTSESKSRLRKKDSAIFYLKLNSIKNLADNYKKAGTDKFQGLAPVTSDDPSVVDNKGDLNYFSALDMVYQFENAAYTTKIGEISPIVRTKFGYHILKVNAKRKSSGEITVAHIMAKYPKEFTQQDKDNAKKKINELYEKLQKGESFDDLARQFSDDKQSADRAGLLQPFKAGRLPEPFESAAFALKKDGDYSKPVETPYGWHIIKRISIKELPPFEEIKNDLKAKINRDSRSQMGRNALIAKVKSENNFKETPSSLEAFRKVIDSTFKQGTWTADKAAKLGNKEMFNLAGKSYTQNDFADYLESQMTIRTNDDIFEIVKQLYTGWIDESVVAYENSQLETKYVEFRNLMREYRDGILLFDLTDREVWSKAVKDTSGLKAYYEKNKNKYQWDERLDATVYKCVNEEVAKDVRKMISSKKSKDAIIEKINKSSQLNLSVLDVVYLKGENQKLDEFWKKGVLPENIYEQNENKYSVIVINQVLDKTIKKLPECRGMVTADYQTHLETEWLNYLQNKYKVTYFDEVLKTIK
ncbi:MAG: peptidylprolyl isomerase [Bacteroidia bacterium]